MGRKKTRCEECKKVKADHECIDCGSLYCEDCAIANDLQCDCIGENIKRKELK